VPLMTLLFPRLVLVLALFASALFFTQRRSGPIQEAVPPAQAPSIR
jgi:hypothetical protein